MKTKKSITLKPDEIASFQLETHEGGGYLWRVVSNNEPVVKVQIKPLQQARAIKAAPIGKSFPVEVELQALAAGEATIVLEERRGWEKDSEPLNVCTITVTIDN